MKHKSRLVLTFAILAATAACGGKGGSGDVPAAKPPADGGGDAVVDGDAVSQLCVPGELSCGEEGQVLQCSGDGMARETVTECDDGNVCTDDGCAGGGCAFEPTTKCDDGDECTEDLCLPFSGECSHAPLVGAADCCSADVDCADGFECTTDLCDLATKTCANQVEKACAELVFKFGEKGINKGQLKNPKGMDVFPDGRVAVADSGNDRVQFFSASGEQIGELTEAFGTPLKAPGCVYRAASGTLYVCDTGNDRMILLNENLEEKNVWPPVGYPSVFFFSPLDVVVDEEGVAYVADGAGEGFDEGNRIMKITEEGPAGLKVVGTQGKTGQALGNFNIPSAITLSPAGELFVTDQGNDRFQILDPEDLGPELAWGVEGDEPGQLDGPSDIVIAPNGLVVVADAGNQRVQVFEPCDPDCTGRVCGDDGCGGSCLAPDLEAYSATEGIEGCPSFAPCNDEAGQCEGWVGEGGDGCVAKTEEDENPAGCGDCVCQACVCEGVDPVDPAFYYEGGDSDPFCCDTAWDETCVFECMFVCGHGCQMEDLGLKETTYQVVDSWHHTGTGNLAAPLKIAYHQDRYVYVLDTVKATVYVYRLFFGDLEADGE